MRKVYFLSNFMFFVVISLSFSKQKNIKTKLPIPKHHLYSSGGITGVSMSGCNCHGAASMLPTISLTGLPSSPIVGNSYPLTLTVNGTNPAAGFNLSATSGIFENLASDVQLVGTELTHNGAPSNLVMGTHSFTFNWKPDVAGNVTFNFALNNINLDNGTSGDLWRQSSVTVPVQTLPVRLLFFNGINHGNSNTLVWKAEREVNFKSYEVQKSCDGLNYTTIETMLPQQNSSTVKTYQFEHIDNICNDTKLFYRLKLNNLDNSFEYSSVISLIKEPKSAKALLFPNPIDKSNNQVNVFGQVKDVAQYLLYNSNGILIQSYINTSNVIAELILPNNLSSGNYYLKIIYKNKKVETLPFVKQ